MKHQNGKQVQQRPPTGTAIKIKCRCATNLTSKVKPPVNSPGNNARICFCIESK